MTPSTTPTRHQDRFGLPVTTSSEAAAAAYVQGLDQLLAVDGGAEVLLCRAIDHDERFALAYVALAVSRLRGCDRAGAAAAATTARGHAAGTTAREQRHVEVVTRLILGDAAPGPLGREHLAEHPGDALVLLATGLATVFSGADDWAEQLVALCEPLAAAYEGDWWYPTFLGLGYQEVARFADSERMVERSFAARPGNPWTTHLHVHNLYETDEHDAAAGYLHTWLPAGDPRGVFFGHLGWHLALEELLRGDERAALAAYRAWMLPFVGRHGDALVDMTSLLWRMRLYGCATPAPWGDVDAFVRTCAEPTTPFADAHVALGLAGVGDPAALDAFAAKVRSAADAGNELAASMSLPLVEGVAAYARGDAAAAVDHLAAPVARLSRLAASYAQREVVEETFVVACLEAGLAERALPVLRRRLDRRPARRDDAWAALAGARG